MFKIISSIEKRITNIEEIKSNLPKKIIGYSSGENETLSIPFISMYSKYAEGIADRALNRNNRNGDVEEFPRLVWTDYHMNIAILDEKLINYRLSPIQASIRIETSRTCADEFYLVLDKYLESKIHIFNSLTLKKYRCYKVYGNLVTPALNFLSAGNDIEAKRLLRNALFLDWFLLSFIDFRLCKYLLTTIVFFFASYTNLYKPLIKLRNSFIMRRHH